ncbi:25780_t:CDS:2, partial [Gigaspora rosea]
MFTWDIRRIIVIKASVPFAISRGTVIQQLMGGRKMVTLGHAIEMTLEKQKIKRKLRM